MREMSHMIQCDKCKKMMFADSRTPSGSYWDMKIQGKDGHSTYHLCSICHRQLLVEFMRVITPEEYDEEIGIVDHE